MYLGCKFVVDETETLLKIYIYNSFDLVLYSAIQLNKVMDV